MKITKAHFTQLNDMIEEKITNLEKVAELQEYIFKYSKNGGNWEKRFRWALLYSIPYKQRIKWFDEIYKYANDDHVDTALLKIMKKYM